MTRCRHCHFDNPPAMKFCGGCGQPLPAQPERAEAERRQLTVMFCDLVGSAALADRLDPEELRDVIRAYQQAAGEAIRKYEGHVAQHLGDGLLVYFGYPLAHEDDARRAVHAGLGVLAAMDGVNARLPAGQSLALRIGVHTGPVVTGEIGSGTTRERLALGATPNIAARLQEIAGPGHLVISEPTRRLLAGAFPCEPLGARSLKGITEPVEAFQIAGPAAPGPARYSHTEMVGRRAELEMLVGAFERVGQGHGGTAVVLGEAGLGKSTLIRAFQTRVTGASCAWYEANCSPYEQASALRPVAAFVRHALGLPPNAPADRRLVEGVTSAGLDPAEAVPLLAGLLGVPPPEGYAAPDVSPQKQRELTLDMASRLLLAHTASAPVVVLLEDLHWADPSTVEFLRVLLRWGQDTRALLLLSSRPMDLPELPGPAPTSVRLGPASPDDVERIVLAVTRGKALPRNVLSQIVAKTDGVPLFVEELTKAIVESGALTETAEGFAPRGDIAKLSIPASLQASLTARLDRLPAGKDVVQLASVIGREFSFSMLEAVSDRPEQELAANLELLVDVDLLHQQDGPPEATYVFKHALIRDAAYAMLLRSTRREYHGRIATTLVERFPAIAASRPELVAQHLTEAGESAAAVGYWLKAGQQAARQSANLEAVSHLRRGLALVEAMPASAERDQLELALRTSLGSVLVFTQGFTSEEVEASFLRAQELSGRSGDVASNAWVTIGILVFRLTSGEVQVAARIARDLLARVQASNDGAFVVRTRMLLAWCEFFCGNFAEVQRHLDQVLAQMPALDVDSLDHLGVDARANANALAAMTSWHLGEFERSRMLSQQALTHAREVSHAFSLTVTLVFAGAEVSSFRRDLGEVQRAARELSGLCETHGFPAWLGQAAIWQAWAAELIGGAAPEATAAIDPASIIAGTKTVGNLLALSYFATLGAEILLKRGRLDAADAMIDDALRLAEATGDRSWAAETHRIKARIVRRHSGERPAADALTEIESYLTRAIEIAREQGTRALELRAALDLGRLWQHAGRDAAGRDLVAPIYATFRPDAAAPDLQEARAFLGASAPDGVPYTR